MACWEKGRQRGGAGRVREAVQYVLGKGLLREARAADLER